VSAAPVESSAELWRQLVRRGDLQDKGRDRELVRELADRLQLPTVVGMAEALATVPLEQFVVEFFRIAEPFAAMWQDLLALFERAAATTGSQQLDIRYDFGGPDPALDFDLNSFRSLVGRVVELMSPFDLRRAVDQRVLWNIYDAFGDRRLDDGADAGWREVAAAARSLRAEPFPTSLPSRPRSNDARLDGMLGELWILAGLVLEDLRTVFGHHGGYQQPPDRLGDVPSGMPIEVLRITESDYWLSFLLEATARAVPAGPTDLDRAVDGGLQAIADRLDAALEPLRNADPSLRSPQRVLEELLSLPLWQHRYDLYSNWVATRIVEALEDAGPIIHSARQRLDFSFSGTHLATFDRLGPRAHLWCEFRAPLLGESAGTRKANIQPDITLRQDPLTARLNPLVVECKQYAKPAYKSFAAALTDYAQGHSGATVILVNYGPGEQATVLDKVPPELRPRTAFVPMLRPGSSVALSRFTALVRGAVDLPTPPQPAATDPELTGSLGEPDVITLRWEQSPDDLDLHLLIGDSADWDIGYQFKGTLDGEPYARLLEDVRRPGGAEVIQVSRWLPFTYYVEVVNFSGQPALAAAQPTVEVGIGGETRVFHCPSDAPADRWLVCAIDGVTRTIITGGR
jgi:hypothetical protein